VPLGKYSTPNEQVRLVNVSRATVMYVDMLIEITPPGPAGCLSCQCQGVRGGWQSAEAIDALDRLYLLLTDSLLRSAVFPI
jgi:hypothetical protein